MTTIDRHGKKRRKHYMMSAEVVGALEHFAGEQERSRVVERAVLAWLIDQHGVESVLEAIEDEQDELAPEETLASPKELDLPA